MAHRGCGRRAGDRDDHEVSGVSCWVDRKAQRRTMLRGKRKLQHRMDEKHLSGARQ